MLKNPWIFVVCRYSVQNSRARRHCTDKRAARHAASADMHVQVVDRIERGVDDEPVSLQLAAQMTTIDELPENI